MTTTLEAFTCGHLTIPMGFLLDGHDGEIKVPVCSYLITHPKGRVIFDSGLNPSTSHEPPADHIGDFLAAFHQFDFGAGEDLGARLESVDVDPGSVTHVINSHLHFDHCGGNCQLPNATIVTQGVEWDAAFEFGQERGYVQADFDTGQPTQRVTGEHDLFGDGTVVCIPTPGHTPGHQSLRVRTEAEEFILCGDACYLKQSLDELALPGIIADPDQALQSLKLLRSFRDGGATIMYGHDPDFWKTVPMAPARLA